MPLPDGLLAMPLFSTDDARRHGIDDRELQRATRHDGLQRVRRGWYTTVGDDPLQRYLARCESARRDHALPLTATSALARHGLPLYDLDDEPVHLVGPSPRTRGDIRVHAPLPGGESSGPGGICVPLLDAVLTAALTDPVRALAAADAAVRDRRLDAEVLRGSLTRLDRRAGSLAARAALRIVDGQRESVGESRVALLCHGWGLRLEPQHRVALADGRTAYADFRIEGTRVLIEFDGRLKYGDGDAVFHEKRREDALRALGYTVVRVVWADLYRPAELRRTLLAAIDLDRHTPAR